jgi:hypothetical protein
MLVPIRRPRTSICRFQLPWAAAQDLPSCNTTAGLGCAVKLSQSNLKQLKYGPETPRQKSAFCDSIPNRGGPAKTLQEVPGYSRAERQPQSRSEKYLQGCRDPGRCRPWTVPRVPRRFSNQRDEANDGAPDAGPQNCSDHVARLEERSLLRRPTSKKNSGRRRCVFS